jgi:hypothetical protein
MSIIVDSEEDGSVSSYRNKASKRVEASKTTFTTLLIERPAGTVKTSLPRLEQADTSKGLNIIVDSEDGGRRIFLPE